MSEQEKRAGENEAAEAKSGGEGEAPVQPEEDGRMLLDQNCDSSGSDSCSAKSVCSTSMDALPRIRVKAELFNNVGSKLVESPEKTSPLVEDQEARVSKWKKALLIRDLDLVHASIKIIVAIPPRSKQILSLVKLIYASLKDAERVLMHNHVPVRRLDLSTASSLTWYEGNAENRNESSARIPSGPWKKAVMSRSLDLVLTCVHALMADLPQTDKSQLAKTAFSALKDLHSVVLNDFSSALQITDFKDQPSKESASSFSLLSEDVRRSPSVEDQQELTERDDNLQDAENDVEQHREEMPPISASLNGVEGCSDSVEPLEVASPQPPKKAVSPLIDKRSESTVSRLCAICERRLAEGRCVACTNFALNMEESMKQNVFYECSHADNSGGVNCKVCRYNLVLRFMPDYASQKKIEVIRKQIAPRLKSLLGKNPKPQQQRSVEPTTVPVQVSNEVSEKVDSEILDESEHDDSLPSQSSSNELSSIVISNISSLSDVPNTKCCQICNTQIPGKKCVACYRFAWRMSILKDKNIFYECAHNDNSGSPKCRVCRYNRIILLRAEDKKKVVPKE